MKVIRWTIGVVFAWFVLSVAVNLYVRHDIEVSIRQRHAADEAYFRKEAAREARSQALSEKFERERQVRLRDVGPMDVVVETRNWAYSGARLHLVSAGHSRTVLMPKLHGHGEVVHATFPGIIPDRGFCLSVTRADGRPLANFPCTGAAPTPEQMQHLNRLLLTISESEFGFSPIPRLDCKGKYGEEIYLWTVRHEAQSRRRYRPRHRITTW